MFVGVASKWCVVCLCVFMWFLFYLFAYLLYSYYEVIVRSVLIIFFRGDVKSSSFVL